MKTNRAMLGLSVMAALLCLTACSSDDDSNVPARCNQTAQSLCEANANCSVETGEIPASQHAEYVANCVSGFKQTADCSRATKITGDPDACEMELSATPCAQYVPNVGLPLPASCHNLYAK